MNLKRKVEEINKENSDDNKDELISCSILIRRQIMISVVKRIAYHFYLRFEKVRI